MSFAFVSHYMGITELIIIYPKEKAQSTPPILLLCFFPNHRNLLDEVCEEIYYL
jgi:hypothetical protein